LVLISLFVYFLVRTATFSHWVAGFFTSSYPLLWILNVLFVIVYFFTNPKKSLLSLFCLVLMSWGIFERTLKIIPPETKKEDQFSFSVLSYNLMYGNYFAYKSGSDKLTAATQKKTLDTLTADVFCFQEFYNDKKTPDFNILKNLKRKLPYYEFIDKNPNHIDAQGLVGLAVFSRFPIVAKKELYWPPNNNGLLIVDLKISEQDTIRLMNVHLKSMGIRVQRVLKENKFDKEEGISIIQKLKTGFTKRAIQTNELEKEIIKSPYPVILAGDFNEMPYGYSYGKARSHLNNSFEDAGFGFGFTYRKILNFLRIDNIFYDKRKLKIQHFSTLHQLKTSDHYPVKSWFKVR
jgi:endonuclease/exonuclease/phosphatase (EEP) superfamily protein YafD